MLRVRRSGDTVPPWCVVGLLSGSPLTGPPTEAMLTFVFMLALFMLDARADAQPERAAMSIEGGAGPSGVGLCLCCRGQLA